jgi:hypothetical protein
MKNLFKQVKDFINTKEKQADLNQSKTLLMELTVKDRSLVNAIQLKAEFDSLFLSFLAEKKIETEENLEKINWYYNSNTA